MFWTFVIAFTIFTSIITCENINSTNAKWKYDIDTANLLQTELDIKSSNAESFEVETQGPAFVTTESTYSTGVPIPLFPSVLKGFPRRSNKPPQKSPSTPQRPPRKSPSSPQKPPRKTPTRSPPSWRPPKKNPTRGPSWKPPRRWTRPTRKRWTYPTRRWRYPRPGYPNRPPPITVPRPSNGISNGHSPNLTTITWQHDCNSQNSLAKALQSSAKGIVADVIMGYHGKNQTKQPVMRQKGNNSDFSLEQFLTQTIQYHVKNKAKIIKLNFGSFDAVQPSITILLAKQKEIKFPLWLNADVVNGPDSNKNSPPIDGDKFIEQVKKLNSNVVLSLGWARNISSTKNSDEGYSISHIEAMAAIINKNQILASDHKVMPINFPIRAVYALPSQDLLRELYNGAKTGNPVTFTVQAAKGDAVHPIELQEFIKSYDVENIYIDLPDELRDQLNLGKSASSSSLIQFGLLNLLTLIVVTVFWN